MLERDEAPLITTEVSAVYNVMAGPIDITVPSARDAGHSKVKT